MAITVWHSAEDFAKWFVANTMLATEKVTYERLSASDAEQPQRFHKMPDHLKQILYLDSPDVIVECDGEPVMSIEVTEEAGTGHNAFQRFSRIVAAVENDVPGIYIYPEAKVITRTGGRAKTIRWDALNPNVFAALEQLMDIHRIPALLFYFPSQFGSTSASTVIGNGLIYDAKHVCAPNAGDPEMRNMFDTANAIMRSRLSARPKVPLMREPSVVARRNWMRNQWALKGGAKRDFSPKTATITVPSGALCTHLQQYTPSKAAFLKTNILMQRPETVIYQVGGSIRGDPYAGATAALDYLMCRFGPTFEDRNSNLVVAFGEAAYSMASGLTIAPNPKGSVVSADDFVGKVSQVRSKPNACLLAAPDFASLKDIPRYYMQARYGCSFTKAKEIRIFAFFADALLFHDGAFWREG